MENLKPSCFYISVALEVSLPGQRNAELMEEACVPLPLLMEQCSFKKHGS